MNSFDKFGIIFPPYDVKIEEYLDMNSSLDYRCEIYLVLTVLLLLEVLEVFCVVNC